MQHLEVPQCGLGTAACSVRTASCMPKQRLYSPISRRPTLPKAAPGKSLSLYNISERTAVLAAVPPRPHLRGVLR